MVAIREIMKTLLIVFMWTTPIVLTIVKDNGYYLFLFIISAYGSFSVFTHYEELERISKDSSDGKTE